MDKERLKLIVRNLKQLVDALESEVHSDLDAYKYDTKDSKSCQKQVSELVYRGIKHTESKPVCAR